MSNFVSHPRFPRLQLGLILVAAWHLAPVSFGEDAPIRLDPYTVKADYPAVEIRFKLSGQKLFEPLDDPILTAVVSRVAGTQSELELGDTVVAINGTELAGLSLRQIADVVTAARRSGIPIWQIRRVLQTKHIYFDGDWNPALPSLNR